MCVIFSSISIYANEHGSHALRGEAMADRVFAMDSVVDCGDYTFALSSLDGYRYNARFNELVALENFQHDQKNHAYLFTTTDAGLLVHHKIIIDWPESEQYGLWYRERLIKGKNKVTKSKCQFEAYVRESIRDDHPNHP